MKSCIMATHSSIVIVLMSLFWGCSGEDNRRSVIVYVSEDQVFSEPILKDFEQETGVRVKAVYDTEEAKGTGVMNRLIAERNNPQADVYWANEPIRAEVLKQLKIGAPYFSPNAQDIPDAFKDPDGYWTGFSARARVLIVNKGIENKPMSILAYTDPFWKGQGVIANPLFGTTTIQMATLFALWGDEQTKRFMDGIRKNDVKIATSNGESADLVAAGEFAFSLVDSDDAVNRMRQDKAVAMIFPDQGGGDIGALVLPNATVLINGAPHPEEAEILIDYLLSKDTERKLAFADCAQIPLRSDVDTPEDVPGMEDIKAMQIEYAAVAKELRAIMPVLKKWVDSWE